MDPGKTSKKTNLMNKKTFHTKTLSKVNSISSISLDKKDATNGTINAREKKKFATSKNLTNVASPTSKKSVKQLTINTNNAINKPGEKIKSKFCSSLTPRGQESAILMRTTPVNKMTRVWSQVKIEEVSDGSSKNINNIISRMSNLIKMNSNVDHMINLENSFDNKHKNLKLDMIYYEIDSLFLETQELLENNNKLPNKKDIHLSYSAEFNTSCQNTTANSFFSIDSSSAAASERRISIYNQCFHLCNNYLSDVIDIVKSNQKLKKTSTLDISSEYNISLDSQGSDDRVMYRKKSSNKIFIDYVEDDDSMENVSHNTSNVHEDVKIMIPHSNISHVKKPSDSELTSTNINLLSRINNIKTGSNKKIQRIKFKSQSFVEMPKVKINGNEETKNNDCVII